jgi:hypothetical protein
MRRAPFSEEIPASDHLIEYGPTPRRKPPREETMKERRKMERFDLRLPATIELLCPYQGHGLLNLLTTNICAGGAYFHTTQPLPEDTRVKIGVVLPLDKLRRLKDKSKKANIRVTGMALRSESGGMAICFDEDYEITAAAHTRRGG